MLAASLPAAAGAQATQNVPPDDPVYAFVDRLVASRLVDTVLLGKRMMSRREVGRIIAEARRKVPGDTGWLGERLAEYAIAFPAASRQAPWVRGFGLEITATESPSRGIDPDGSGAISVDLNPLVSNRLGRPYADGGTASAALEVGFGAAPWLALHARQRVSQLEERGATSTASSGTEQAYVRALWKNVALQVGRDHVFFGQGNSAGLTSSLNPPAIDQLRLASDRPFILPWLLRYAGPVDATILLGDLGPAQLFPHTRFLAYKVSARPHRRFEIGVSLAEQVGGEGSPGGTFGQKAGDALPLLDALFLHRNFLFSNKFVGVDLRYSIPKVRGLQFYAEGAFDDFDLRRVRSVFTEDAGYVWGASMSCFAECGPVRASAEYHVTGLRYYTHGIYRSGYTVNGQIIGDQLGPRGRGGYGIIDVDRGTALIRFESAYEVRNGDKYGAVATTPDDSDFRFVKLEQNPVERRWRASTSLRMGRVGSEISYRVEAGVERVENFAHVARLWRTNWMTQLGIEYRPTIQFDR